MKSFPLLLCALCVCGFLSAQQLSLFTQYRENATIINPAAMESDFLAWGQHMTAGANYRSQWNGISGNPTTQSLRFSFLGDTRGASLLGGGYLINDQTGPTGLTGLYARLGAVISGDPEYSGLAVALSGGLMQYRVNSGEIQLRDPNDVLGTTDRSQLFPDVGVGVYYYQTLDTRNNDMFYAGVSVPQVAGLDLTFKNDDGSFAIQRVQHFYGMLGLYHFFRNDGFIEPSLWIKYVNGSPINADVNIRYQTPNAFWIGTGVSTAGNFHFEAGVNLGENAGLYNNIRVGYSYDYSFSTFGPIAGDTHEIQVAYSFDR
ncbi:MAG: type IX secretion system membrane protein PorP/SprF [Bacteroidetes bacterium]|nr:MAG: type IX secretion system membrane protein PorP/SprF [Bacteroidota bacterium]